VVQIEAIWVDNNFAVLFSDLGAAGLFCLFADGRKNEQSSVRSCERSEFVMSKIHAVVLTRARVCVWREMVESMWVRVDSSAARGDNHRIIVTVSDIIIVVSSTSMQRIRAIMDTMSHASVSLSLSLSLSLFVCLSCSVVMRVLVS